MRAPGKNRAPSRDERHKRLAEWVTKMIVMKLFGSEAEDPAYRRVLETVRAVAQRLGPEQLRLEEHPADDEDAAFYGVVLTPTLVVNDTIVSVGKVIPAGRLLRLVQAELGESPPAP